jgi:4-carboxymuconolactone decarboxylase
VSDGNYARVLKLFGERGTVDLVGVIGYYTLVSMILNVDRVPIPGSAPEPLPPLA